ncbi:MAG: allophycocyanin, partial [Cyanobacteria bacterium J06576_12]
IAECMRCLKEEAMSILSEEDAQEVAAYFDLIIH